MQGLIHSCMPACMLSTSSRYDLSENLIKVLWPGNHISRHQNLGRWSKLEATGRPATSYSTHVLAWWARVPCPSLPIISGSRRAISNGCSKSVMGVAVPRDPVEIWSAPTKVPPERDTWPMGDISAAPAAIGSSPTWHCRLSPPVVLLLGTSAKSSVNSAV